MSYHFCVLDYKQGPFEEIKNNNYSKYTVIIYNKNDCYFEFIDCFNQICVYREFNYTLRFNHHPFLGLAYIIEKGNQKVVFHRNKLIISIQRLWKDFIRKKKFYSKIDNIRYREITGRFKYFRK